jgi:hypothetical protein
MPDLDDDDVRIPVVTHQHIVHVVWVRPADYGVDPFAPGANAATAKAVDNDPEAYEYWSGVLAEDAWWDVTTIGDDFRTAYPANNITHCDPRQVGPRLPVAEGGSPYWDGWLSPHAQALRAAERDARRAVQS